MAQARYIFKKALKFFKSQYQRNCLINSPHMYIHIQENALRCKEGLDPYHYM